jgi:penicillin-binding protein 1A
MILDAPLVINIGHGTQWKPQNISKKFYGSVTLREALENSYNLAPIRLAQEIGMKAISEMAKRLNLYDDLSHELANALGAQETTLLRAVTAYASFVNGGKKITPLMIDRIQDRHGKNLYHASTKTCDHCQMQPWEKQLPPILEDSRPQVLSPSHAYQMVSMLEGAVKGGTSKRAAVPGYNVAGKTGTTNNYFDAWFIGFSPDLLVGVVVGFDNPKSLGRFQTGGMVAAPIFGDFMKEALAGKPAVPFRIPSGVKFMRIDKKTGKTSKYQNNDILLEAFSDKEAEDAESTTFSGLLSEETGGIY